MNATIDANAVTGGGGGSESTLWGGILPPGDASGGGAANGGAVFAAGIGGTAAVSISNSILANSSTGQDYMAYGSTTSSGVGNLVQSQSGFSGQIVSTANPNLTALGNYGGPTETMALKAGSPAIGAGNNAAATAAGLTTDQRGAGHPRIVGAQVDIGADAYQPLADLLVTNTAVPSPVFAGGELTYTVVVQNVGGADAALNDTLSDALPAGTTLVSVTTPSGWTETDSVGVGNNGTLTFTDPSLAPNSSSTFTVVVQVPYGATNGTVLSNAASATTTSTEPNPNPSPSSATAQTTVVVQADLGVAVSTPANVIAGQDLTYTVVVTNYGPDDAQNVTMSFPMPAGTTLVSVTTPSGWTEPTRSEGGTAARSLSATRRSRTAPRPPSRSWSCSGRT